MHQVSHTYSMIRSNQCTSLSVPGRVGTPPLFTTFQLASDVHIVHIGFQVAAWEFRDLAQWEVFSISLFSYHPMYFLKFITCPLGKALRCGFTWCERVGFPYPVCVHSCTGLMLPLIYMYAVLCWGRGILRESTWLTSAPEYCTCGWGFDGGALPKSASWESCVLGSR